jgi:death-on-curing protein
MLDAIHDAQIREHGGASGIRDVGLIESALARPQQKWSYDKKPDLATLAAAYAFGLAKNHGYVDGNKRVAFLSAYVFLGINGHELEADERDVVDTMELLASGRLSEAKLAEWVRAHMRSLP